MQDSASYLKTILEPFTDDLYKQDLIIYARLTNPFGTFKDDLEVEVWKPLVYADVIKGRYLISSWGRLFDEARGIHVPQYKCDKGYLSCGYQTNHNSYGTTRIHRLVAEAFIPKITDKTFVNHKDLCKTNNNIGNLEWVDNQENITHGLLHGSKDNAGGHTYFTPDDIRNIKAMHSSGDTLVKIAKKYDRTHRSISNIIHGRSYTDIFWEKMKYI